MRAKRRWVLLCAAAWFLVTTAGAEVRVFVESSGGVAWLRYECTAGEVVRALALDVAVDQGVILGVSDFFVGESSVSAQGYGVFPSTFRDHITMGPGNTVNWDVPGYTPLAVPGESGALGGLGTAGVTLEFGGLWDPEDAGTVPGAAGTLCALRISEPATVTVSANGDRGGVVSALQDRLLATTYTGAPVRFPEVTGMSISNGVLSVSFDEGELETAPDIEGPWTGTGDRTGHHVASPGPDARKLYRARGP